MSLVDGVLRGKFKTYDNIISNSYSKQNNIPPCNFHNGRKGVELFVKRIQDPKDLLIFADVDVDGVISAYIVYKYLRLIGYPKEKISYYINKGKVHGVTDGLKQANKGKSLTIIVDSSSNDIEDFTSLDGDVIVLDHHVVNHNSLVGNTSNGEYVVINSTLAEEEYKFSGGMVVYEFLSLIDKYIFQWDRLENSLLIQWAIITMYTDVIDLDTDRTQYYLEKYLLHSDITGLNVELSGLMNEVSTFKNSLGKNLINFKIAPRINKYIRGNAGVELLDLFLSDGLIEFKDLSKYEKLQEEAMLFGAVNRTVMDNYVYVGIPKEFEDKFINYSGVIASRLVNLECKNTVVFSVSNGIAKGSFRGVLDIDYRSKFDSFPNTTADGHKTAFGFTCPLNELDMVMNSLVSRECNSTDFEPTYLITFGDNIKQGSTHFNSLDEMKQDGSLSKVATLNSRLSSKDDIYIYCYLDESRLTYTVNAKGNLYTYNIGKLKVKSFSPIKTGVQRIFPQLINNKVDLIFIVD